MLCTESPPRWRGVARESSEAEGEATKTNRGLGGPPRAALHTGGLAQPGLLLDPAAPKRWSAPARGFLKPEGTPEG